MARKIFISILGTSAYLETRYFFGDKPIGEEKPMRFVQEASISFLCKNWKQEDKVIAFLEKSAHLPKSLRSFYAWFIGAVVCPFTGFFIVSVGAFLHEYTIVKIFPPKTLFYISV